MSNQGIKFDVKQRIKYHGQETIMKGTILSSSDDHVVIQFDGLKNKTYLIAAD